MSWRKVPTFIQTSAYRNNGTKRLALISLDQLAYWYDTTSLTPPEGPGTAVGVGDTTLGGELSCTCSFSDFTDMFRRMPRVLGTFNQPGTPLDYTNVFDEPGVIILEKLLAIFGVGGTPATYNFRTASGTDAAGHGTLEDFATRAARLGARFSPPIGTEPDAGEGWLPASLWTSL